MIRLDRAKDCFAITIRGDDFDEQLAKVKALPFSMRRWNPKDKIWEIPEDVGIMQRVVQSLEPELSAEVELWMREQTAAQAEAVATDLPDDAELPLLFGARALYPYQRAGIDFLLDHPRAILADDMGLGKTVQSIAAVLSAEHLIDPSVVGPKLVICPNSAKLNWEKEIKHWVPILLRDGSVEPDVVVIDGTKAKREKAIHGLKFRPQSWVIVNWEKLRIMPELAKLPWDAVIADEAHRAKNRKAQQTKALWKIKAPQQFCLTGTPIMNRPDEIWSMLRWLFPDHYTSYWRFFEQYVDYYEGYFGRIITGVRNPDGLRFELSDKLARRTKKGVLDLPEKTRVVLPVAMGSKQRRLYDEVVEEFWVEVKQAASEGDASAIRLIEAAEAGTSLLTIPNAAARTTRMRQVAASPALLGAEDNSAKLDAAVDLIADGGTERQWVVFTHFKDTGRLLAHRLEKLKVSTALINGDVKPADREANVEAFQAGTTKVLICTIATGGVALTLTAADSCIFIEQDWVPANNTQAEDRLHRIGQHNAVTIYIIQAIDSIDTEKISPTLSRKRAIVGAIIESDD